MPQISPITWVNIIFLVTFILAVMKSMTKTKSFLMKTGSISYPSTSNKWKW